MTTKGSQKSRHQVVSKQNENIRKLLNMWGEHIKHEDPNHQLLTHDEIDSKLDWLVDEMGDEHDAVFKVIAALTVEIRFNAQPFWKRWLQTWRTARDATKNSHRPVFLGAVEADADRKNLDPALGDPVAIDTSGGAELPKEIVEQIENSVKGQAEEIDRGLGPVKQEIANDLDEAEKEDRIFGELAAKAKEAQRERGEESDGVPSP